MDNPRDNRTDDINNDNRYNDPARNRQNNPYNNNQRRSNLWPWVAGIIVIALVAILVFSNNNRNDRSETAYNSELDADYSGQEGAVTPSDNTRDQNNLEYEAERDRDLGNNSNQRLADRSVNDQSGQNRTSKSNNPAVASYIEFVESGLRNNDDLDAQKVGQAFRHLAEATDAKASELGVKPSANLRVARENIDHIASGSAASLQSQDLRQTAEILSNELANLQKSNFPSLDNKASNLQKASQSISPDEAALDQRGEIRDFFTEAADLLEDMEFDDQYILNEI
jgi:hypothetical protein